MEFLKGITPREYQKKIFESCINKNCLVVLPTGIGKTLIALMLTIERMRKFPGEKVVFLAPTKPLIEQHLKSFQKHLPELFADMQLFTGAVKKEQRKKIWQTADIIFSTPQCIANDIKKNLYNLEEVCLLIEDEAHRCVKNYDYTYIAREYKSQSKNSRIVGLTASPGSDKKRIQDICKNLYIQEVELRTRESKDVKEYLQELEFQKILINFPPEFEEMKQVLSKIFNEYVEELKKRNVLFGPVNKISLIELQKKISSTIARGNKSFNYLLAASTCAQSIKIQHAIELLETQTLSTFFKYLENLKNQANKKQSRGVVKLVNKPEFNFVFSQANELLKKDREHPKMEKLFNLVKKEFTSSKKNSSKLIIFSQFRETAKTISKKLNEIKEVNAKVFVGQAKKQGSGLSQKEQKKMIEDFSEGKINILCATSIAEEGLDIPEVKAVIFYEAIPSAIRTIQRAGRTARLMKGKIIMLITKKTRDEIFFYASKAREKKMHSAISSIKEDLANGKKLEHQNKLFEE